MGRSVGPPLVFTGRIVPGFPSTITIHASGPLVEHRLDRRGVVAKYPVAYSWAGIVGYSCMVWLGRCFSHGSYYTQTKKAGT